VERSQVAFTVGQSRWNSQAIARWPLVSGGRDVTDGGKAVMCMGVADG
jgi:hypothetical protein